MIVIGLTPQVNTDAELKALTGMDDQHIIWHNGTASAYMYRSYGASGQIKPDVGNGWWIKESFAGLTLEQYRALRFKEVDQRTGELISEGGFTYLGKTFSMSSNAQTNILALDATRDDPAMTYPILYNTKDDLDTYEVPDSANLHGMYLTALGTKKAHTDSGSEIKSLLRAAVDENAIEAIIDNR